MQLQFAKPDDEEMKKIIAFISEYRLDDEALAATEFIIAKFKGELVGFVRLRHHNGCEELCTLGVVEKYRGLGIGKALSNEVKKIASGTLYLVCIIPGFFEKLGFTVLNDNIPAAMSRKHQRCTTQLTVKEEYCVMQFVK